VGLRPPHRSLARIGRSMPEGLHSHTPCDQHCSTALHEALLSVPMMPRPRPGESVDQLWQAGETPPVCCDCGSLDERLYSCSVLARMGTVREPCEGAGWLCGCTTWRRREKRGSSWCAFLLWACIAWMYTTRCSCEAASLNRCISAFSTWLEGTVRTCRVLFF